MKLQSALLHVMALALLSASCEPGTGYRAQVHKKDAEKTDTLKRKKATVGSLGKDTASRQPIFRDYCPPCGRG